MRPGKTTRYSFPSLSSVKRSGMRHKATVAVQRATYEEKTRERMKEIQGRRGRWWWTVLKGQQEQVVVVVEPAMPNVTQL